MWDLYLVYANHCLRNAKHMLKKYKTRPLKAIPKCYQKIIQNRHRVVPKSAFYIDIVIGTAIGLDLAPKRPPKKNPKATEKGPQNLPRIDQKMIPKSPSISNLIRRHIVAQEGIDRDINTQTNRYIVGWSGGDVEGWLQRVAFPRGAQKVVENVSN